ncbi:hypothetical protein LOD99_15083 [Oopsacas minuta]|uniref:MULE transposase domain-containing protein n=1 Tax=Oopsacas minuta TaxID=111878 RepID=A0AAV7KFB7_9METZ|nr:hypothetical protein LOD99_15083 [Oopsacas minuta]
MLTASEGTAAKLPELDSLKRTIQRQRASVLSALVQPTALAELVLPAEYQRTAKGEQFLLYDSGEDYPHRFLNFGTQRNLGMLQQSKIWLADGTFKTTPPSSPSVNGSPLSSEIGELVDYFERTYIGRTLATGYHVAATIPIGLWNYHFSTSFGLPRTTNAVEAWHRSFNATVGCHHPTIWKFLLALKREQGLVEVRQTNYLAGKEPTKRRRSQQSEQVLRTLVGEYIH